MSDAAKHEGCVRGLLLVYNNIVLMIKTNHSDKTRSHSALDLPLHWKSWEIQ